MKRIQELVKLSEEHHLGLVLARKAKMAANGQGDYEAEAVWEEIDNKFISELEPHFQIEENFLAPPMLAHGEDELIARFYKEHEELREMVNPSQERSLALLKKFGEKLDNHIRFEERQLFEKAQEKLSADELKAIENAFS